MADRLTWVRQTGDRKDQREAARIIPIYRNTTLRLPDGREFDATIADLSRTGAALVTPERPSVGGTVTVGTRFATVVRHTSDGIGVAFRLPFGTLTFNEGVVP